MKKRFIFSIIFILFYINSIKSYNKEKIIVIEVDPGYEVIDISTNNTRDQSLVSVDYLLSPMDSNYVPKVKIVKRSTIDYINNKRVDSHILIKFIEKR